MKLCPQCNSEDVLVYAQTSYWVNTGKFHCHSSKTHDHDADCRCIGCGWAGFLQDLKERQT